MPRREQAGPLARSSDRETTFAAAIRAGREMATVRGRQRTVAWLLGLIATAAGPGCTSTQRAGSGQRQPAVTEVCFNVRNVDTFSPLEQHSVHLRTLGGENYLLTLDGVYTTLPFATGITISNGFSSVCSNTGATITFVNFGRPVFCRIVRVESVPSKETAEQRARQRRAWRR